MDKHIRTIMRTFAILVVLCGLTGVAGTASAQNTDPVAVVRAFIDANNRGDIDTMRSLVDPGVRFVFDDPNAPTDEGFEQFIVPPLEKAVINSITQTAPDTASASLTLSGGDLPALPFPVTLDTTWTVMNGKITREVGRFSAETVRNFEALGPPPGVEPGMPRSGQGGSIAILALPVLAFGLLFVLVGVLARRGLASM